MSRIILAFDMTQGNAEILADFLKNCVTQTDTCSIGAYAHRRGIVIDPSSVDIRVQDLAGREDLRYPLARAYVAFRDSELTDIGPVSNALNALEEAMRQFGLFPSEADEVLRRKP